MSGQLNLFDYAAKSPETEIALEQEIEPVPLHKDAPGLTLPDLVPEGALLALNRGYPIQANHVGRILRLAVERRAEKEQIKRDEIAQELAISWARVQGTINVMRRCQLLRSKNAPTPLGSLVHARSPFIDDSGLLWLLHYLLASNARLVLWSHLWNQILPGSEEISVAEVTPQFGSLSGRWSESTLKDKIPHELGGILRTYTDEMFLPLGVLTKHDVGTYVAHSNTASIPPLIWLTCLLAYRDRYYPGVPSLEVRLIADANYSPGRLLRQREAAVRRALDELHDLDALTVETRSGLDQVRFRRDVTWLSALARYFEDQAAS